MKISELFEDVYKEDLRYEFKAVLNQDNPIKWAKTLVAFLITWGESALEGFLTMEKLSDYHYKKSIKQRI